MALLIAAIDISDTKMVKLLISGGAGVNDRSKPLLYAAKQCKADIVQVLIEHGAELEIDCLSILRAPLLTRKPGYLETLKALLAAGADPNLADLRATPVLATALDLPLTDSKLQTPDFEAARILIEAGADVNQMYGCPEYHSPTNPLRGTTLLHRAVWRYHLDVVNFLLEKGAKPNAQAFANPLKKPNRGQCLCVSVPGYVIYVDYNHSVSQKPGFEMCPRNGRHRTKTIKNSIYIFNVEYADKINVALSKKGAFAERRFDRCGLVYPSKPAVWGHNDKADADMRKKLRELRGAVPR